MSEQQTAVPDNETPSVIDLATLPAGTRIKPIGSDEVIDPGNVVSKSNLTRESKALAEQRENLADAVEAYEFLNRDPEEFKRQLDEIVAATAAAGARIGDLPPEQTSQPQGRKMPDDDIATTVAGLQAELARTKDELTAVKNITLNGAATSSLEGEVKNIAADFQSAQGRQLSPTQLTEIYKVAADNHLPSLTVAYEAWLGRTLKTEAAELREQNRILEKEKRYPMLGGSSERSSSERPKGRSLREIYDEHVSRLE